MAEPDLGICSDENRFLALGFYQSGIWKYLVRLYGQLKRIHWEMKRALLSTRQAADRVKVQYLCIMPFSFTYVIYHMQHEPQTI